LEAFVARIDEALSASGLLRQGVTRAAGGRARSTTVGS
jgi:hypothetical protein